MKNLMFTVLFLAIAQLSFSQKLTQTVRGKITDTDSKLPLIGATVFVAESNPKIGVVTDVNGDFRLENIETGRITLLLSYIGYENKVISNIVVNSGKEVVLNIQMQESTVKMDEVVVVANDNKGRALNEMAVVSARSISAEETNRYAGGFNDPSRILSNFAGVTSTQDGSNDIIVRGNSPKYVQWRLEGVQITNPNHFGDQSAVGGAVSTLNNNLIATSDFYTGAFAPEFGDALSGVYDVQLRAGNNEKFEAIAGVGLLGTDLTLEGPFKKGYGGSYLVNYRFSTATLISDLGLIEINGVPKFQDAAFKIVLPTKKMGQFSLFGLSGLSGFDFKDVQPDIWQTPGDRALNASLSEDFDKESHLLNVGINHSIPLSKKSFIKTTLAYSNEGIADDIFETTSFEIFDGNGQFIKDSISDRVQNLKSRLSKSTYRAAVTYHHKINARHKIQVGSKYALFDYKNKQSHFVEDPAVRNTLIDFDENISTIRNFVSWKYRLDENITFVSGLHNMNVLLNNKSTLEGRLAVNWKLNDKSSFFAGYGNHSTMESIHNYFAKVTLPNGNVVEPNRDLDLLKAHHYVLGYERRLSENLTAKVEAYYQYLYNLPVENVDSSYYATINEGLNFQYVDLVNKGTGENYGIELTVERFFNNNFYYLVNGSLYSSTYKSLEGITRNTQYNGNYLVNILLGKEFEKLGKKKNRTLGLNAKILFAGGRKIIPLLRDEAGNVTADPANNRFWDYSKAYDDKIEDVYQIVLSASYKWNKPKATHEIFLNLDNITNTKGKISEYYDEDEPGSVGYLTQFGFFPNLMYRVYF